MNKNYINVIRKSVNKSKKERIFLGKISKTFPVCNYQSESVFLDEDEIHNKKRKLLRKKSGNPKKNKIIKKKRKIERVIQNVSHNNDYLPESSNSFLLTPSKSEINQKNVEVDVYSDSNDSDGTFELDEFSNTRDCNSSVCITDAYSEIEDEFLAASVKNIRISRTKIIGNDKDVDNFCNRNVSRSVSILKSNTKKWSHESPRNTSQRTKLSIHLEYHDDTNGIDNEIDNDEELESLAPSETDNDLPTTCDTVPVVVNAKYFDCKRFRVVILKNEKSIPVYGYCLLKILRGKLQVLGCELDKSNEMTDIFSPRGSSLLVLKNITSNEEDVHLKELYQFSDLNEKILNTVVEKNSAVFLCFKMNNHRLKFIEKYLSQQIFPKIHKRNLPQIIFEPKDMNILLDNDEWESIMKSIKSTTKMFIAGGKGVGKSTFLRFAINKFLSKFEAIRIIDLDPGQSEFFIPGCISVINVSQKCIGPNFTHLQKPER